MIGYALTATALNLWGKASDRRQSRRQAAAQQEQQDRKEAGIDFSIERLAEMMPSQAAAVKRNEFLAKAEIDQAQAEVAATMKVNAAQAGVTGESVELGMKSTVTSAARSKQNLIDQTDAKLTQMQIDLQDKTINAETSKGILVNNTDEGSRTDQVVGAGLTFLSAYASKL